MTARDQGGTQGEPTECPECRSEEDFNAEPGFWYCEGCGASWTFEPTAPSPTTEGREGDEVEALAALLCDFVDGNGYWARAGDVMRDRYRHAARCLRGTAGYRSPAEVERLLAAARADAWDQGHDSCGQRHSCYNPYRPDTEAGA